MFLFFRTNTTHRLCFTFFLSFFFFFFLSFFFFFLSSSLEESLEESEEEESWTENDDIHTAAITQWWCTLLLWVGRSKKCWSSDYSPHARWHGDSAVSLQSFYHWPKIINSMFFAENVTELSMTSCFIFVNFQELISPKVVTFVTHNQPKNRNTGKQKMRRSHLLFHLILLLLLFLIFLLLLLLLKSKKDKYSWCILLRFISVNVVNLATDK